MKGTISISRMTGGDEGKIHISIVENNSRVEFFEGLMSLEDFAAAVTGSSYRDVEFEFRPEKVGMIAENKEEIVDRPKGYSRDETAKKKARKLMEPFEVDGWKGNVDDMFNGHRNVGNDKCRVRFFRHVAATPEPSIPS